MALLYNCPLPSLPLSLMKTSPLSYLCMPQATTVGMTERMALLYNCPLLSLPLSLMKTSPLSYLCMPQATTVGMTERMALLYNCPLLAAIPEAHLRRLATDAAEQRLSRYQQPRNTGWVYLVVSGALVTEEVHVG